MANFTPRLKRILLDAGCRFERQGKGDHEIWINPDTHARTTIPNWGARDLKVGTIGAILRDLGISREHFERA